jgi:hypothetical protein
MAYNALLGQENASNVGQKYAPKEDLARTLKVILTPKDFQFATQSDAETESNWQDAFEQISSRCFVLPYVYENEDNSEEAVRQDFPGGDTLEIRPGRYASRDKFHLSVSDMKKMASFNNKEWRMFKIDANGNIQGTSSDEVVFKGFELTEFNVEKMNQTIGDVKRLVPVYYKEREPSEWTDQPVVIQPLKLSASPWDPRDLDGLTDVEITVNSSIATLIVVTVTAHLKGVLISGFDEVADWILTDAQTITGVTDNNDGTYDLAGSGLVTGTINLSASADLSQDGYESTGAQIVTVA